MCIYYGNQENLTYTSAEHIFPATIGGIKKLPLGYVSKQANQYFSNLESNLITNSFLGLPKSFSGPGKRGSYSKPGRLPISIMTDETTNGETLGFVFKGKPCLIPQIIISNNILEVHITHDANIQTEKDLNKLIQSIDNFEGHYTLIEQNLSNTKFLIGHYENRLYIATQNTDKIDEFIKYIKTMVIPKINYSKAKKGETYKPKVQINMLIAYENDSRVFAKTAINVLANLKGAKYLKNKKFAKFISWILGRKDDNFAQIPQNETILKSILPYIQKDIHYCALINIDNFFVAFVCFYGLFCMGFKICKAFDSFFANPYILFCDWKNKKEFTIEEFLMGNDK